jgi:hypothetical protein
VQCGCCCGVPSAAHPSVISLLLGCPCMPGQGRGCIISFGWWCQALPGCCLSHTHTCGSTQPQLHTAGMHGAFSWRSVVQRKRWRGVVARLHTAVPLTSPALTRPAWLATSGWGEWTGRAVGCACGALCRQQGASSHAVHVSYSHTSFCVWCAVAEPLRKAACCWCRCSRQDGHTCPILALAHATLVHILATWLPAHQVGRQLS